MAANELFLIVTLATQFYEPASPRFAIPSRRQESPGEAQARSPVSAPASNESPRAVRERLRQGMFRGGST